MQTSEGIRKIYYTFPKCYEILNDKWRSSLLQSSVSKFSLYCFNLCLQFAQGFLIADFVDCRFWQFCAFTGILGFWSRASLHHVKLRKKFEHERWKTPLGLHCPWFAPWHQGYNDKYLFVIVIIPKEFFWTLYVASTFWFNFWPKSN